MYVLRLVPMLLSLFVGVQFLIVPNFGYAWCCGCGYCGMAAAWGCSCAGWDGCPYCLTEEPASLASSAPKGEIANEIRKSTKPALYTVAQLDLSRRIKELTKAPKCFRDKVVLSLLSKTGKEFRFEPIRFEEKSIQPQILSLQMRDVDEK